jgi:hypothetical protein
VIKTFSLGILLGIVLAALLVYLVPVVDQHREASIISVQANGGNTESFHVNLPDDRILFGAPSASVLPAALDWPDDVRLASSQAEIFKIRNQDDDVVGVGSRIAGAVAGSGRIVEWTLHLPARGSVYASMSPTSDAAGVREGRMLAGTREFANMHGAVRERLVESRPDGDSGSARIEVVTALVGKRGDAP